MNQEYKEGRMLTKEVKNRLVDVLYEIVSQHQSVRAQVTEEMVDAFMAPRPLPNMFG
jgi:tryptophanyl-tRNA synthetase